MCGWLPEAISYAKTVGFPYVFLTTNGSLADASTVKACMEAGLDSLKFSMNNADPEQFEKVAGVKSKLWVQSLMNQKILIGFASKVNMPVGFMPPVSNTMENSRIK